jgi:hypothetical protein
VVLWMRRGGSAGFASSSKEKGLDVTCESASALLISASYLILTFLKFALVLEFKPSLMLTTAILKGFAHSFRMQSFSSGRGGGGICCPGAALNSE